MIFAGAETSVSVAATACIENSRVEVSGKSELIVEEGVVLRDTLIVLKDSNLYIGKNTTLQFVNLFAEQGSSVTIAHDTEIEKYDYMLYSATFHSDEDCHFCQGRNALRPYIRITENGSVHIGSRNVIRADFWVRFGGKVEVGQYNCINERTEIRCDESVMIGDFNMISYDCNIWDTNTHCQYGMEERRAKTIADFPIVGKETERPKTKPVVIGSDCWIGKQAVLLKGTRLGNQVTVGVRTLISNKTIPQKARVVSERPRIIVED